MAWRRKTNDGVGHWRIYVSLGLGVSIWIVFSRKTVMERFVIIILFFCKVLLTPDALINAPVINKRVPC